MTRNPTPDEECDMCGCRRDVHRNLAGRCLEADQYGPCGCLFFIPTAKAQEASS